MSVIDLITELKSQDIRLWLEDGQLRFSAPKGAMTDDVRLTLKSHKQEIIQFLNASQQAQLPKIERINYNDFQPLSYAQERIWFLSLLEPDNSAFHLHHVFDIKGKLDKVVMERVLNEIINRHSVLRTAYIQTEFGAYQKVIPHKTASINHMHVNADKLSKEEVQALANQETARSFNLEVGEVTHNLLVELNDEHHMLFLYRSPYRNRWLVNGDSWQRNSSTV